MAMMRPVNLGSPGLTFGGRLPQMPTQQPAPKRVVASPPDNRARDYALAEVLGQPISVESGMWGEAVAEALAAGLRGRSARRERQDELDQETEAQKREEEQRRAIAEALEGFDPTNPAGVVDRLRGGAPEEALELATVLARQSGGGNQNETRVTSSGTFWRPGGEQGYEVLGRDPNWQPPAAMAPWGPMSPEMRQQYPGLNPSDTQVNQSTGEIRQIPGAAGRQRATERQARAAQSAMSALSTTQNVRQRVQDALQLAQNPTATGLMGQMSRGVGGTPGFNLDRAVDTIKANLGFEALQQMRQESPTGGALGQVAVIELQMLQAVIDSLDTAQSRAQVVEALQNVDTYLAGREQRMQRFLEAYEQDFQDVQPAAPAGPPDAAGGQSTYRWTPERGLERVP